MPPLPYILPDDADFKNYMWLQLDGHGGGGPPPGGSGVTGPFIPTFGSGQAQPWGGLPQQGPWAPQRRLRAAPMRAGAGRTAFSGRGGSMPRYESGGAGKGWGTGAPGSKWTTPAGPAGPWVPGPPDFSGGNPGAVIAALLQNAVSGGAAGQGFGGLFGIDPPEAIMQGVRQQAVQDAGARERAARLGLQSRGDADPSTYGFQALQSQLQGQDQTARAMSQANLGLRQQQLENYWGLLRALLGEYGQNQRTYIGTEGQRGGGGFDWGGLLQGVGNAAATALLRGGPSRGSPSAGYMGQPGWRYPLGGGY